MSKATEVAREAITAALAERAGQGATLVDQHLDTLSSWAETIMAALRSGGCLYTFGNGGSAADAEHLSAELVGRYHHDRRPLASVALTANTAAITAIANDYGFDRVFARQVHALAGPSDVVLGISTSGRSPNVLAGLEAAADVGAHRLALVGGGEAVELAADSVLAVTTDHTPGVQEAHRLVWHLLCVAIDAILEAPLAPAAGSSAPTVSMDVAVDVVARWRASGDRIATTNGCFDVLHEGHVATLAEARRQADRLVVLCNTDESVRRAKGADRPVVPFAQRTAVLAGLRSVDLIIGLADDLPNALLERLRPDVHVKGGEYAIDDLPEAAVVIAGGGRVHLSAMVADRSTTAFLDQVGGPG